MSESDTHHIPVHDRRRFNPDGSPREEPAPAQAAAPSQAADRPGPEQAAAEPREDELEGLREKLEAAHRRIDELARALSAGEQDREDFKKRVQRERDRLIEVEKGNVAQVLLEAVDELDLSLASVDESPLARGVRMIRDGILARLANLGVERLELLGKPFDPRTAEAVDTEWTTEPEQDGHVIGELRPAYKMGSRVIREGRVRVARYVAPAQA